MTKAIPPELNAYIHDLFHDILEKAEDKQKGTAVWPSLIQLASQTSAMPAEKVMRSHHWDAVAVRFVLMAVGYGIYDASLHKIARILGYNHTSVLYGIRSVAKSLHWPETMADFRARAQKVRGAQMCQKTYFAKADDCPPYRRLVLAFTDHLLDRLERLDPDLLAEAYELAVADLAKEFAYFSMCFPRRLKREAGTGHYQRLAGPPVFTNLEKQAAARFFPRMEDIIAGTSKEVAA